MKFVDSNVVFTILFIVFTVITEKGLGESAFSTVKVSSEIILLFLIDCEFEEVVDISLFDGEIRSELIARDSGVVIDSIVNIPRTVADFILFLLYLSPNILLICSFFFINEKVIINISIPVDNIISDIILFLFMKDNPIYRKTIDNIPNRM